MSIFLACFGKFCASCHWIMSSLFPPLSLSLSLFFCVILSGIKDCCHHTLPKMLSLWENMGLKKVCIAAASPSHRHNHPFADRRAGFQVFWRACRRRRFRMMSGSVQRKTCCSSEACNKCLNFSRTLFLNLRWRVVEKEANFRKKSDGEEKGGCCKKMVPNMFDLKGQQREEKTTNLQNKTRSHRVIWHRAFYIASHRCPHRTIWATQHTIVNMGGGGQNKTLQRRNSLSRSAFSTAGSFGCV